MKKIRRTFDFISNHPLAKKHFIRSVFRFMYWQLQRNLKPNRYIVKTFISPVKFYARQGLSGITGNIYTGLHEFDTMGFLLHFLRSDDTFFDLGANVGSYTLLASGVCKANTLAVEPIPATFKVLSDNVELNNLLDKVKLVNAGVGDENGTLTFTADQDTNNHVVQSDEVYYNTIDIPIIKMDELVDNAPTLIKIDVEGFESRVLNGMPELLKNSTFKALIIEMSNAMLYGFNDEFTLNVLASHGFSPFTYDPFKRQLVPVVYADLGNYIYCRDMDFVNDRIKNAPPVKIMGELI